MTDVGGAPPNSRRPKLLDEDAIRDVVERVIEAAGPRVIVPGWATVELDRAAEELAAVGDPAADQGSEPADLQLGARTRFLVARGTDTVTAVMLEASTEGLLAAAIARHGEGWIALYLIADGGAAERVRRAGFGVSTLRGGPLGPQRLVRVSPRQGPFLMLVAEA